MNLMIATQGEYSDYKIIAVIDWKSQVTPEQVLAIWRSTISEDHFGNRPGRAEVFVSHCIKEGYAEEVEIKELFLGCAWIEVNRVDILDKQFEHPKERRA